MIQPRRLAVIHPATKAIDGLLNRTNITDLRSFLGLCNFYLRLVSIFLRIEALLTKGLKKDQQCQINELTSEELKALETLEEELISPAVLVLPRCKSPYIFDTHAFDKCIGCVLTQD